MADPLIGRRAELEALGWEVRVLEGLDHLQAMQADHVLAILRPWLTRSLGATGAWNVTSRPRSRKPKTRATPSQSCSGSADASAFALTGRSCSRSICRRT